MLRNILSRGRVLALSALTLGVLSTATFATDPDPVLKTPTELASAIAVGTYPYINQNISILFVVFGLVFGASLLIKFVRKAAGA